MISQGIEPKGSTPEDDSIADYNILKVESRLTCSSVSLCTHTHTRMHTQIHAVHTAQPQVHLGAMSFYVLLDFIYTVVSLLLLAALSQKFRVSV